MLFYIFVLGGGGRGVRGWDGRGGEGCIYSWNGKSLVRVVYLLILKLFNVDQHISFKYNFSMFNFLCDGFFTIQPIQIHNQCYSMGETRSQGPFTLSA